VVAHTAQSNGGAYNLKLRDREIGLLVDLSSKLACTLYPASIIMIMTPS